MKINHSKELDAEGYYVVAFDAWGVALRRHRLVRVEMREWCKQSFGLVTKDNPRWKDDLVFGEVRFKSEKDLTLFLIRWANE